MYFRPIFYANFPQLYYNPAIQPPEHTNSNQIHIIKQEHQQQNIEREVPKQPSSIVQRNSIQKMAKIQIKHQQFKPQKKIPKKQGNHKKSKQKSGRKDEQFKLKSKKMKKKRQILQNKNRNVIPNIIHQIFSFLFKRNRSSHLVERLLIKLNKEEYSLKGFYSYQFLIKEKISNYVNADSLLILCEHHDPQCQFYSSQQQECYLKISRILALYFFTSQFDLVNLTSNRMDSEKRIQHLRAKRVLLEKFQQSLQHYSTL